MRLHSRISLHFLGVLLVVGLATSAVFAWSQRGAFVREITERVTRHVATVAAEDFGRPAVLAGRVRRLHDDLEIDVTIRDLTGQVMATAGRGLPALSAAETAAVRSGRVVVERWPVWFAAAAIRDPASGAVVGTLQAAAPRRFRAPGLWRPALAVTLVLVIVAGATVPLARRISRPVERLTEATRRLGEGDLGYRVPLHAPAGRRAWWGPTPRIDELGQLTRAFNDMADRVERLVRGQKELLANVSHELRSPLARIRVALALLPREGTAEARLAELERDLTELDRLIDDVLTAARLDAMGLPTDRGPIDVNRLLLGIAESAGRDPLVAGGAVRVADGPVPSVVGDERLLRRALWNLVENAAKYGAPPITLGATRAGDWIELSVTDEGEGIPPDERERVFTPFYRVDRARTPVGASERAGGVGLGLTLARRVAEVHGGSIEIGSLSTVEGVARGCRVTLRIPAG